MLLRPTAADARVILRTTGRALGLLGLTTLALALLALLAGDVETASALAIGGGIGLGIGAATNLVPESRRPITWTRGAVIAVTSWVSCAVVGAVPLYLSGHYASYLDALFEAVSGLTTTGLTLVQDLDHMATTMSLYRELLELGGGLAIVVFGLTILSAPSVQASSLEPSDVRDERIMPSYNRVWHAVARIASGVVAAGLVALVVALLSAGVPVRRVLLHAVSTTVSAAATGGFAPMSTSIGYYHSLAVELALLPLMMAGATSFVLHVAAWRGSRRSSTHDLDARAFAMVLLSVFAIVLVGLGRSGAYTDLEPLARRGLFMAISAQTTTGLSVVPPRVLALDWGFLAPAALVLAMTIGGMTGSTSGGLKSLRVGLLMKGLMVDVKRVLLPESAVVVSTFLRNGRRAAVTDGHVRAAATLLLIFLVAVLGGAVGVLFVDGRVTITDAIFSATSAASNSGLSAGVLTAGSPAIVKAGFMALMLLGRLEWLAVFTTVGFLFTGLRGRN